MLKVTDRDRIFVAVALPVALVALYIGFVHRPIAKRICSMEARLLEIGRADVLRSERLQLERRRDEAHTRRIEAEVAEEARRAATATNATTDAYAPADASARLRRVVALLGKADGVRISSTSLMGTGAGAYPSAGLVKEALGGEQPALWRFAVVADYGGVLAALRLISDSGLPVVVEAVSMEGAKRGADGAVARTWRMDVGL